MRYNIDLLKQKEDIAVNNNISIEDRMSDPYLATRIDSYKGITYQTLKIELFKNPLLYDVEKETIKIEYLDEFCLEHNKKPYSLGGIILTKDIKKKEKKRIIREYFKNNAKEYNKDLGEKIIQTDNILNLSESYKPSFIKFKTLIFFMFITVLIFIFSFPIQQVSDIPYIGPFLNSIQQLINNSNELTILKYISFTCSILSIIYILFYNITTKVLKDKYDNNFDKIRSLSKKVKKYSKKQFKKLQNHYLKQILKFKIKKYKSIPIDKVIDKQYRISNFEKLNNKTIALLSKIKNMLSRLYKFRWLVYILTILFVICYVTLIIIYKIA